MEARPNLVNRGQPWLKMKFSNVNVILANKNRNHHKGAN